MENQVADTILETKKVVMIDGTSYAMAPPSIATLILFSKYVGQLPNETFDNKNVIASIVGQSENLTIIGYALASVILGVKEFHKPSENAKKGFFGGKLSAKPIRTKGEDLAEKINNADIEEVLDAFVNLLEFMRFRDFFQLTTSLTEMNLTKRTKAAEVETKTTAFGQ
ncbi:hypothetical protein [Capnocytophaga sp.]|uniref:hypothetical protein n=1 Tax=Capnocytophaga sp. TaxID=44737 RepID=UPI0026DC5635|nr:hypothetical protein [Capnocytophaga sp.]MDO5106025.1 hypothetical protein [Capnocytophaga sp.]